MHVNITGSFNSTSYGGVLVNVCKALVECQHEVTYFPLHHMAIEEQVVRNYEDLWRQVTSSTFDMTAPCLKIWHQNDLAMRVGKGLMAAFSFFELDRLKPIEIAHMASQDVMLVASHWAKEVCENSGVKAQVAPLGVDTNIFRPVDLETKIINREQIQLPNKYTFYMGGKFEVRKGHDVILDLFQRAFPNNDDVQLIINSWSPNLSVEDNQEWARMLEQDNRVIVIKTRFPSQYDLSRLMSCVDCGIFPSKAEGWNLPALECLAMHIPVILNNYSAHTEFSEYCTAIEPKGMATAFDGIWFDGQCGQWSVIDEDGFVEAMRDHFYGNITHQVNDVSEKFTWHSSAQQIVKILESH